MGGLALRRRLAQNWVKADKLNAAYVADWRNGTPGRSRRVDQSDNTLIPNPRTWPQAWRCRSSPAYSKDHPGTFPGAVEHKTPDGKTEKTIEPVKEGSDIQVGVLRHVAAGASRRGPGACPGRHGDGLRFGPRSRHHARQRPLATGSRRRRLGQEDRNTNEKELHDQIEQLLRDKSHAPLGGLVGVPLVNVLEVNLALRDRYQKAAEGVK